MAGNKRVGQNNSVRSPKKEINRAMLWRVTGAEAVGEGRAGGPAAWESLCVGGCPWGEGGRGPVLAQLWMKFPLSFTLWTQGGSRDLSLAGSRASGAGGLLFYSCLSTTGSLSEPALLSNLTAEWGNQEEEATPKTEHPDFHRLRLTVYNYDSPPPPLLPHCPTAPRAEAKVQICCARARLEMAHK